MVNVVPEKGSPLRGTARLFISFLRQKSLEIDKAFFSLIEEWCGGELGKPCILCTKMQYFKTKNPGFGRARVRKALNFDHSLFFFFLPMWGTRSSATGLRRGTQFPLRSWSVCRRFPLVPVKRRSDTHLSLSGWSARPAHLSRGGNKLSPLCRRGTHLLPLRSNRLWPLNLWHNLIRCRWFVHLFFTRRGYG